MTSRRNGWLIGSMSKIKKLIKNPHLFIRDFLNKKYPVINCEQGCFEVDESTAIACQANLISLDSGLGGESRRPIDVVFTWVDNKDPFWVSKYKAAINDLKSEAVGLYGDDDSRFENHNELYYSILSVRRYMPWVRKIFIVTDDQRPDFLDGSKTVFVVDHKDIIDDEYLPTFNSHVIEAFLHRIDGLSEDFIYFNDDVFVARDLLPGHFFRSNGLASIFVAKKSLREMANKGVRTPTLGASLHAQSLLSAKYSMSIDNPLVHTYVPLKKSAYDLAWKFFESDVRSFLANKLRGKHDLNMATFLVPWIMYLEKQSTPAHDICYYFNIRSAHAPTLYKKLLHKKMMNSPPHSFCANDFNSRKPVNFPYKLELENMLFNYYKN